MNVGVVVGLLAIAGLVSAACGAEDATTGGQAPGTTGGEASGLGGSTGGGGPSGTGASSATGGGGSGSVATTTVADCPGDIALYLENISSVKAELLTPAAPGQKEPNAFGLYDMLGNATEWTADCYHESYDGAPTDGSVWSADACELWVVRGGCSSTEAELIRSSARAGLDSTGYGGCNASARCVSDDANPSADFTWVDIPGGTFTMGCSAGDTDCDTDELPAHEVTVAGFKMMAMEPTQVEYWNVTGEIVNTTEDCADCAVTPVSYAGAQAFCAAVGGRLPSEAEWEYAARAGSTGRFYCGN